MRCKPVFELYSGKCVRGRDTRIVFCGTCGYAHIFPKPTEAQLAKYYKSKYYQKEKPAYGQDQDRIGEYLDVVNMEKIAALGRHEGLTALDVGCGRETRWMKCLSQAGYWVSGVDPCFKRKTVVGGFEVLPHIPHETYSVISLNFVLEHVPRPKQVLAECRACLGDVGDGGKLLVEVPWDFNPEQMLLWDRGERKVPWWVSTPDHVSYFAPSSLEGLLRSAGFRVEVMRSTYPIEQLLLQGHDYRKDPEAKKLAVSCRAERQREWWALGKSRSGSGRTVWCVAIKE